MAPSGPVSAPPPDPLAEYAAAALVVDGLRGLEAYRDVCRRGLHELTRLSYLDGRRSPDVGYARAALALRRTHRAMTAALEAWALTGGSLDAPSSGPGARARVALAEALEAHAAAVAAAAVAFGPEDSPRAREMARRPAAELARSDDPDACTEVARRDARAALTAAAVVAAVAGVRLGPAGASGPRFELPRESRGRLRLRAWRVARRIPVAGVAAVLGVSAELVDDIEAGAAPVPPPLVPRLLALDAW